MPEYFSKIIRKGVKKNDTIGRERCFGIVAGLKYEASIKGLCTSFYKT